MIPQFVLLFTLLVVYCYQQADKLARRILAKRPNEPESLDACARAAYYLGNAVRYAGANTKAHQLFKEAVAWSKTLHEASGGDDEGQRALRCDYLEALGEASLKLDGFVDAASAFAEALLVAQGLTDDGVASLEEWPAGRVACKLAAAQVERAEAAEGAEAEAEAEAAKEAIQQALRTLEAGGGRRSVAKKLRVLRAMLAEAETPAEEVVEEEADEGAWESDESHESDEKDDVPCVATQPELSLPVAPPAVPAPADPAPAVFAAPAAASAVPTAAAPAAFVARAAAAPVAPPPPNGFQNASATTAPAAARTKKRRKQMGLASKLALPDERDDERDVEVPTESVVYYTSRPWAPYPVGVIEPGPPPEEWTHLPEWVRDSWIRTIDCAEGRLKPEDAPSARDLFQAIMKGDLY